MTAITVHDGARGIGGNKILIEENGKGVFLDFGKNFGKYGLYYEEFLKNRDSRGIHDLVHLDLIPKLDIYRSDLLPADVRMSSYPSRRLRSPRSWSATHMSTTRETSGSWTSASRSSHPRSRSPS
ncbi:MAG: hypothetical protein WC382_08025 [Methanoregulaceae archaeon]|jgi:hypothetical protein